MGGTFIPVGPSWYLGRNFAGNTTAAYIENVWVNYQLNYNLDKATLKVEAKGLNLNGTNIYGSL